MLVVTTNIMPRRLILWWVIEKCYFFGVCSPLIAAITRTQLSRALLLTRTITHRMKTSTAINNCTETGSLLSADNSSLQAKKSMWGTPLQKKPMAQSVLYCRGLQSAQSKPTTRPNMLHRFAAYGNGEAVASEACLTAHILRFLIPNREENKRIIPKVLLLTFAAF
jgi:hypothetical protein